MAITFVGSHVGTHAATSAQTVNFSSLLDEGGGTPTLQQGDLVLVAVENASTVDRTQAQLRPSSYTAAHTDDYRNDSNDSNFLVSYKVMGVTPDTSVAIPASNATTAGVGYAIYVFRGVNTANPFDATTVVTGNTNTGIANAAAITPVTAGAWIVVFGGAAVAAGAVFTNPAGMSTTTNHFRSATITSTTNDANIGGAIYTGWTSGSYDPAAFGGSTSTNTGSWSAVTLALRPIVTHAATGTLSAGTGALSGSANRTSPSVTHDATGTLSAGTGALSGSAARQRIRDATGALSGGAGALSGSAERSRVRDASGALSGGTGTLAGSAERVGGATSHDATGTLSGGAGALSGSAARIRIRDASGALAGAGANLAGNAARSRVRTASGTLVGVSAMVGAASRTPAAVSHAATGVLAGAGAVLVGAGATPVELTDTQLTEWARRYSGVRRSKG